MSNAMEESFYPARDELSRQRAIAVHMREVEREYRLKQLYDQLPPTELIVPIELEPENILSAMIAAKNLQKTFDA